MTDSSSGPADKADAQPEPSSTLAPAPSRGPSFWQRLKSMLALRGGSLRDDLEVALEDDSSPETADFTQSERTILQNVLKLADKRVDDVMVPRGDIEAIDGEETLGALVAKFRGTGHSRLPVYDDSLDDMLGFIHVKDAMRRITEPSAAAEETGNGGTNGRSQPVKLVSTALRQKVGKLEIVRTVLFVPPSMPVGDLLQSMQSTRVHMAIVVDEYGGTDGLVTIEDLLEAVVGEIDDEYDELEPALVRKVDANAWVADARAELDEVREVVGPEFDPGEHGEDVETIGGLVFDLVGRIPVKGEIVSGLKGFDVEILQSDPRQLKRLMIRRAGAKPSRRRANTDQAAADS